MKYIAKKAFSGRLSMKKGDVKELNDAYIIEDLLNAGYIEKVQPAPKGETAEAPKAKEEVKEVKKKKRGANERYNKG